MRVCVCTCVCMRTRICASAGARAYPCTHWEGGTSRPPLSTSTGRVVHSAHHAPIKVFRRRCSVSLHPTYKSPTRLLKALLQQKPTYTLTTTHHCIVLRLQHHYKRFSSLSIAFSTVSSSNFAYTSRVIFVEE